RDPLGRPAAQGRLDRVLHQVLGRGEVAEQRDQRRGQPPGVLAHHPREHLLVRRLTHQIGRISTMGQAGQDRTSLSASSRSATSTSANPLTTSLPSTNGPSVTTGSPSPSRTVVAVCRAARWVWCVILSAWSANHCPTAA